MFRGFVAGDVLVKKHEELVSNSLKKGAVGAGTTGKVETGACTLTEHRHRL